MKDGNPFEAIKRRTISEQVADQILELITTGQLKPSDRLPSERELATQLGVGRTSVREALRHLTMVGLLEAKQGSGTHVRQDVRNRVFEQIGWSLYLNAHEVEDLFPIRRVLEGLAVELAAKNATSDELEQLMVYEDVLKLDDRNIEQETEIDLSFHLAITKASHNPFLVQLMHSIQRILKTYIQRSIEMRERIFTTYQEHRKVCDAIIAGNPERAREAMEHHLVISHERIRSHLR